MGQNNIEKQIAEKLNAREIQPSAQAWDRLDAMLSVAEEKKTRRSFGWLYIAAGILVFLSVGTYWYNQGSTTTPNNEVVTNDAATPAVKVKSNEGKSPEKEILPFHNPDETVGVAQNEGATPKNTDVPSETQSSNRNHHNQTTQKTNVLPNTLKNTQLSSPKLNQAPNQEAVAVTQAKKEEVFPTKGNTINPEVVAANENTAVTKVKVNANSLLSEVDTELELTFRDRVLKKVGKNYKEVKVALANRNFN